ncbi:CCA tRNA nucleotidyltransferase [Polycladidibacter hongkongensis]|uniref:CCA tRNA nucleotidyltransferase n=1 Tax=Polycladidibacter hongkongensis TaxID=1647556 RepID=UPI000833B671|nr:CCA tRNA nucleotidyltransferase [Pseudovibrio hongkongensis]
MIVHTPFAWLNAPAVQRAFDILEQDGAQARAVGGTVRNALLGLPVSDIDIACDALPEESLARARAAGVKVIATGLEHGTITLVIDGQPIEVTTLREDVETDGRHAVVRFGKSWERDACRRDFTMNALYVDRNGELFDPLGGLDDCLAGRLRFIGEAGQRIQEDYLRILRFFRFFARFVKGEPEQQAVEACERYKAGLAYLSPERVTKEVIGIISAPRAGEAIALMAQLGVLQAALRFRADEAALRRLLGLGATDDETRLAALLGAVDCAAHVKAGATGLRLSNKQIAGVSQRLAGAAQFSTCDHLLAALKALMVARGREVARGAVQLAAAQQSLTIAQAQQMLEVCRGWEIPLFSLKGADLLAAGVPAGPDVGMALGAAREAWVNSGYRLYREELLQIALKFSQGGCD